MVEWIELTVSFFSGALLGLLYFRGLWWTVARFRKSANPLVIYLLSLIIRTGLLIACLFLLLQLGPVQMLTGLVGFFIVRIVMVRHYGFTSFPRPEREAG